VSHSFTIHGYYPFYGKTDNIKTLSITKSWISCIAPRMSQIHNYNLPVIYTSRQHTQITVNENCFCYVTWHLCYLGSAARHFNWRLCKKAQKCKRTVCWCCLQVQLIKGICLIRTLWKSLRVMQIHQPQIKPVELLPH